MLRNEMKHYYTISFTLDKLCKLIILIFISCDFGAMQNISMFSQFNGDWEELENNENGLHIRWDIFYIMLNLF